MTSCILDTSYLSFLINSLISFLAKLLHSKNRMEHPNGTSSIQFRQPQPTLQICSLCCGSLAVRPRLARPPDLQTGLNCAKTEAGAAVCHCTPVWASSARCPDQSAGGSSVSIIMTSGEDIPIDDIALLQLFKDNLLNSTLSTASGITAADVTMLITRAANRSIGSTTGCTITEKTPTRALS